MTFAAIWKLLEEMQDAIFRLETPAEDIQRPLMTFKYSVVG